MMYGVMVYCTHAIRSLQCLGDEVRSDDQNNICIRCLQSNSVKIVFAVENWSGLENMRTTLYFNCQNNIVWFEVKMQATIPDQAITVILITHAHTTCVSAYAKLCIYVAPFERVNYLTLCIGNYRLHFILNLGTSKLNLMNVADIFPRDLNTGPTFTPQTERG